MRHLDLAASRRVAFRADSPRSTKKMRKDRSWASARTMGQVPAAEAECIRAEMKALAGLHSQASMKSALLAVRIASEQVHRPLAALEA